MPLNANAWVARYFSAIKANSRDATHTGFDLSVSLIPAP